MAKESGDTRGAQYRSLLIFSASYIRALGYAKRSFRYSFGPEELPVRRERQTVHKAVESV